MEKIGRTVFSWVATTAILGTFLALFVGACMPRGYVKQSAVDPRGLERAVASAVRISIYCNGELSGWGSGVIVSPAHVLTARHVADACSDTPTPDMAEFVVLTTAGKRYRMSLDKFAANEDVDAARLVADSDEFPVWAEITSDMPKVCDKDGVCRHQGAPIYMYTGDGAGMADPDGWPFFFKVGYLGAWNSQRVAVSIHGVPGNSGGAMFDENGRVIALLWGGVWHPAKENYAEGYRSKSWADLIPPIPSDIL